jgi:hypothetical protein
MSPSSNPRCRRGNIARALLAGVAVTTLATGALAEDAKIKEAVFDAQSTFFAAIVEVTGDGTDWTTIVPGSVGFEARMKIDTKWPGYVERVGVWLGECNGSECATFERVLFEAPAARDFDATRSISFSTEVLEKARTGAVLYRSRILNGCRAKPATEAHSFPLTIDATMSANTRETRVNDHMTGGEVGAGFNGGDVTRHDTFEITVRCTPPRKTSTVERKPDPHRTKPEVVDDIDLSLATYHSAQSGPRGTTCKPLKVTTRIETGEAGPKNVKLWRQVNGGPITSEQKQMDAEAFGGGKFGDTWNKYEHFSQTTTVKYMAEMLGGTFAPSTEWKSITIHCNGDYAPPPQSSTNPDDDLPPAGKPQGRPTAELPVPPVIVTPTPTACATGKAAKRGASLPCIKTAPLPDDRKAAAEAKRKAAQKAAKQQAAKQAAERRKAEQENELRRRNAELEAELDARRDIVAPRRPLLVGPGHFGRLTPNPPPRHRLGVSVMPKFLR